MNALIGRVDSVDKSKSGKSWRVKIGSAFYGAKFDSHIESAVGKTISYTVESTEKFGDWVGSWAYAEAAPQAANKPQTASTGGDRFYLPFVSNTVAHGIQAGLIKTPGEVSAWAKAAYEAAQALDSL